MINRVVLTGRLTKNAELKQTAGNNAVATFNLAVDRAYKNQNGDRDTDFVNCVIWRKPAENLAKYTHKGSLIGVDGRLQTSTYENQRGERVYQTQVIVDNFTLLSSNRDGGDAQNNAPIAPTNNTQNEEFPF